MRRSSKLIHHPAERRMAPVLHLDPATEPATAIRASFGDAEVSENLLNLAKAYRTQADVLKAKRKQ